MLYRLPYQRPIRPHWEQHRHIWKRNSSPVHTEQDQKERPSVVKVYLATTAIEILERYRGKSKGNLFPFISTGKLNDLIRVAMKEAGIDRVVTTVNPVTKQSEQHPICEVASSHRPDAPSSATSTRRSKTRILSASSPATAKAQRRSLVTATSMTIWSRKWQVCLTSWIPLSSTW